MDVVDHEHEHEEHLAPERCEIARPRVVKLTAYVSIDSDPRGPSWKGEAIVHATASDALDLFRGQCLLDRFFQLHESDLGPIVVEDPRQRARNLGQRQVGDSVAVWNAAADDDTSLLEPLLELRE